MSFRRVSGSSPGDELQNARRRFMLMLLIMIGVCCVIMGVMTATLYQYEVRRQRALLQANAQSQARLIEAVARYDQAQAAAHFGSGDDAWDCKNAGTDCRCARAV